MFCPRCGQPAAEEVRFCSRCGLPLDAAAELVEAGGHPVPARAGAEAPRALTPRQRGLRKGLMLSAGGFLSFGIVILLTAFKEDFFVLLMPASILLVVGVMRMLYALLLEEHAPEAKAARRADAPASRRDELPGGSSARGELPHARSVPASLYANAADTSDMAASPLSVTESTTRLLDEDEAGGRR